MPTLGLAQDHPRRNVRLDTLVRLRWLAVIGQTTAVLVVYYGLDFELPIYACLAVIALVGLAQRGAAAALPHDAAAGARPRRLAIGLRRRGTGGAPVPDRRIAEPVRIPVPRPGAAVGDRAAAAFHAAARRFRGRLRHRAGVRALSAAVGQRRSAATAADLHDGRLALDPARHGLHRRLFLADYRGIAPARRCARRHRAGAGARAASLAARRPGGRRRARTRHAAVDHHGDRQGTGQRHRAERAARRRRAAVARAGHALPRHPRQAHRIIVQRRRAVRAHAAHRADRGSGGAAP